MAFSSFSALHQSAFPRVEWASRKELRRENEKGLHTDYWWKQGHWAFNSAIPCIEREKILIACRNTAQGQKTANEIHEIAGSDSVIVKQLDLSSLLSVRKFAREVILVGIVPRVLLHNAGVLEPNFFLTEDGFERTLQVNYLAPFLLTKLLLPLIPEQSGRIVTLSSVSAYFGRIDSSLFNVENRTYNRFKAYSDSKRALLMFTAELSRTLKGKGISVLSADPGIVDTDILEMKNSFVDGISRILFRPFIRSESRVAEPSVRAVLADESKTGLLFTRGENFHCLADSRIRANAELFGKKQTKG
jgi:NAD(P)-dependent dehydrogenase (short-subunit alcohol dehydrogenase family)